MNKSLFIPVLIVLVSSTSFCHRNPLRMDQKKLISEILSEEKQASEKRNETEDSVNESGNLQKGIQYKENRSADPAKPPLIIDIPGSLDNCSDMRLSDVASQVKYIKIEPVPDSSLRTRMKYTYHLTDNYIIASNLFGIQLYSLEGKYLRTIVKNEMTGVIVRPDGVMFYNDYTLKGGEINVNSAGDIINYNYVNTMTGEKYIMKYDCSSVPMTPEYKFDPENPDRISGLGSVEADLNPGPGKLQNHIERNGMFGGSPEWLNQVNRAVILGNNLYALPSSVRGYSLDNNRLFTINNSDGDTVASFTRYEKVVNYHKSMARGADSDLQYEFAGSLHFRPKFNDTVFIVVPPNRLVPLYVFKLGNFKVSMQDGIDPDFDLAGKIIPGQWAETRNYIFLTFVKDGYDCPNSRKNKKVKIYHALFSKQTYRVAIIKGDPYNYSPEILQNNIDGGVPVWPSYFMIGNNGEILNSLKGKEIKDRVSSDNFKKSDAPAVNKSILEKLAATIDDQDDILMIIK